MAGHWPSPAVGSVLSVDSTHWVLATIHVTLGPELADFIPRTDPMWSVHVPMHALTASDEAGLDQHHTLRLGGDGLDREVSWLPGESPRACERRLKSWLCCPSPPSSFHLPALQFMTTESERTSGAFNKSGFSRALSPH